MSALLPRSYRRSVALLLLASVPLQASPEGSIRDLKRSMVHGSKFRAAVSAPGKGGEMKTLPVQQSRIQAAGLKAEADKEAGFLAARGYSPLNTQTPQVNAEPPLLLTESEQMHQLLNTRTPETTAARLDAGRKVLRTKSVDDVLVRKAVEAFAIAGVLPEEVKKLEAEMKQDPPNLEIAKNAFLGLTWLSSVNNVPSMKGNKLWVPFAEHLIEQKSAEEGVFLAFARHRIEAAGPGAAVKLWLQLLEERPAPSVRAWCELKLLPEVARAGRLDAVTQAFVNYLTTAASPVSGHPPYQHFTFAELSVLLSSLRELPEGRPHEERLFKALAKHPGAAVDIDARSLQNIIRLAEPAELRAALVDWLFAVINDAGPAPVWQRLMRDEVLWNGFLPERGGAAAMGLLTAVQQQGRLGELITLLQRLNQPDIKSISLLLLAAHSRNTPGEMPGHLLAFFRLRGELPREAYDWPGVTEPAVVRAKFRALQEVPVQEGWPYHLSPLHSLLLTALNLPDRAEDKALITEMLTASTKLLAIYGKDEKRLGEDWGRLAELTFATLIAQGMGKEAESLLAVILPRLKPGDDAVWPLLAGLYTAAGGEETRALRESLRSRGMEIVAAMEPPANWRPGTATGVFEFAFALVKAGALPESAQVLDLLQKAPEGVLSTLRLRLEALHMQRRFMAGDIPASTLAVWQAAAADGTRQLRWTLATLPSSNGKKPQTLTTWPAARGAAPTGTLQLLTSPRGDQWTEAGPPQPMPMTGALPLPDAAWLRVMRRGNDGAVSFAEPLRTGAVSYAPALYPGFDLLRYDQLRGRQIATPAKPLRLSDSGHPGAEAFEFVLQPSYSSMDLIATAVFPVDPLEQLTFTGWIKVEGAASAALEIHDAVTFGGGGEGMVPIPRSHGAWTFISSPVTAHSGLARMVIRVHSDDGAGKFIRPLRIGICDPLLQSQPPAGLPPWPQRIIARLPRGLSYLEPEPGGEWFAASFTDGTVRRSRFDGTGQPKELAKLPTLARLAIAGGDKPLLAVTSEQEIWRVDPASAVAPLLLGKMSGHPVTMALSPDATRLAVWTRTGGLEFYKVDAPVKTPLATVAPELIYPHKILPEQNLSAHLRFSRDGRRLLVELSPVATGPSVASLPPLHPVFEVETGASVLPRVQDGAAVEDITLAETALSRKLRYTAKSGWTASVTANQKQLRLAGRSDQPKETPALVWALEELWIQSAVMDPQAGILYTAESNGIVRRWELPQE